MAGALRDRGPARSSSAHVIEAVRLAETLAALRGRPLAGLAEVTEATRAVLCDGDELPSGSSPTSWSSARRSGSVARGVPTVPLEADLAATSRTAAAQARRRAPDAARPGPAQAASTCSGPGCCTGSGCSASTGASRPRARSRAAGTFRETWPLRWQPELRSTLVEAGGLGHHGAAARPRAKVAETVAETARLAELTAAVERCLLADLPEALRPAAGRAAPSGPRSDADVVHLMEALPALARAQRYGDVRGTDTSAAGGRSPTPAWCGSAPACPRRSPAWTTTPRGEMRRRIDAVHAAVGLLAQPRRRGRRRPSVAARALAGDPAGAGRPQRRARRCSPAGSSGCCSTPGSLDDAAGRVHRALSSGQPAAAKAAWVEGFLAGGALLLVHDAELLRAARRLGRRARPSTSSSTCCRCCGAPSATSAAPERRADRRAGRGCDAPAGGDRRRRTLDLDAGRAGAGHRRPILAIRARRRG